jgi:hypothetical protein
MQSGVTWWSEQFWINVTTTGLGISASVGLAVALYYLKRHHDRQDAGAKRQEDLRWELKEKVSDVRDGLFVNPTDNREIMRQMTRLIFVLDSLGDRISDPDLSKWCDSRKRELIEVMAVDSKGPMNDQRASRFIEAIIGTESALARLLISMKAQFHL